MILRDLELKPTLWTGDPNGYLLIFKPYNPQRQYFLGVDVGMGKGLSNSVIEVVERGGIDNPDEQVAEFACDFLDPHQLAPIVDLVGRYYYSALDDLPAEVIIEVWPGPGEGTQYDLLTFYQYPNLHVRKVYDMDSDSHVERYGWKSNASTRKQIIVWGDHRFRTKQWKLNSPFLLDEMADFNVEEAVLSIVRDSEKELIEEAKVTGRAKRGKLSDRIIASLLALWAANETRILEEDPAVIRERVEAEKVKRAGGDFQNSAISYKAMMECVDDLGDLMRDEV